ncbi:MAG: hypothetical protein L6Q69_19800 [Zoogloea sp.]|nr:hypothetical protein [Zoogloea sp.]
MLISFEYALALLSKLLVTTGMELSRVFAVILSVQPTLPTLSALLASTSEVLATTSEILPTSAEVVRPIPEALD